MLVALLTRIAASMEEMEEESRKQTALLERIAASLEPPKAVRLVLTLGKPEPQ